MTMPRIDPRTDRVAAADRERIGHMRAEADLEREAKRVRLGIDPGQPTKPVPASRPKPRPTPKKSILSLLLD
jgi:hypothetical protein